MDGRVANTAAAVRDGVRTYGVAPGGRAMMDSEMAAAKYAAETGIYVVWRNMDSGQDCTRVGPKSKCFCGHLFENHVLNKKLTFPCEACECKIYDFVPTRPEEVGEWWLPRRKGFNVHTWRAKCKCTHAHDEHRPTHPRRCGTCRCSEFYADYLCGSCESRNHETVVESEDERRAARRPVGAAYAPLADDPELQGMVFSGGGGGGRGRGGAPMVDDMAALSITGASDETPHPFSAEGIMARHREIGVPSAAQLRPKNSLPAKKAASSKRASTITPSGRSAGLSSASSRSSLRAEPLAVTATSTGDEVDVEAAPSASPQASPPINRRSMAAAPSARAGAAGSRTSAAPTRVPSSGTLRDRASTTSTSPSVARAKTSTTRTSVGARPGSSSAARAATGGQFCGECGSRFATTTQKFCTGCGTPR